MNGNEDGNSGTDRVAMDTALRALRVAEEPPPALEDRVVDALGGRILGRGPRRMLSWQGAAAAVAALALFAAGAVVGSRTTLRSDGPAGPSAPNLEATRYALLLLPGPAREVDSREEEAAVVERYRAWAARLAAAERLVLAEKLGATVGLVAGGTHVTGEAAVPATELLGLFIITAISDDDAIAAAITSPHARDGGRIAVVRIEPT